MKVAAFNGSPRKGGNTHVALQTVADELVREGIEVEFVQVGNKPIRGCIACGGCFRNQDERCVIDDEVNGWIQKMKQADGILLGSPVHFAGISGAMKSFLDRAFYVATSNGGLFRHKVGASVTAVRRSGGLPAFEQLNTYITYAEMFMPTSTYWNVIHGRKPDDALQDEEGLQIMRILGKNMAWLMKALADGKKRHPLPEREVKIYTSFIR